MWQGRRAEGCVVVVDVEDAVEAGAGTEVGAVAVGYGIGTRVLGDTGGE